MYDPSDQIVTSKVEYVDERIYDVLVRNQLFCKHEDLDAFVQESWLGIVGVQAMVCNLARQKVVDLLAVGFTATWFTDTRMGSSKLFERDERVLGFAWLLVVGFGGRAGRTVSVS